MGSQKSLFQLDLKKTSMQACPLGGCHVDLGVKAGVSLKP